MLHLKQTCRRDIQLLFLRETHFAVFWTTFLYIFTSWINRTITLWPQLTPFLYIFTVIVYELIGRILMIRDLHENDSYKNMSNQARKMNEIPVVPFDPGMMYPAISTINSGTPPWPSII